MAGIKGRSGGFRVGAGRKPRSGAAKWLSGNPHQHGAKVAKPAVTVAQAPSGPVERPDNLLTMPGQDVWDELAPFATAQGTLTPVTAMAFADLCMFVVLERELRADPKRSAGADHRGMMQRVEAGRARFRLTPDGKPVLVEQPKDDFEEFDGPTLVKGAAG